MATQRLNMSKERSKYSLPPALGMTPLITLSHGRHKQIHTFFDPVDESIHHRSIPEMHRMHSGGCSHGWMMMSDRSKREYYLLNPTLMEVISCPPLPIPLDSVKFFELSSPSDVPSCTMALVPLDQSFIMLRRFHGNEWTKLDVDFEGDEDNSYKAIVSCKGKFYLYTYSSKLVVIDVDDITNVSVQINKKVQDYRTKSRHLYHFFMFGDDIFVVLLYYRRPNDLATDAEVFRLDLLELVWKRVESIGEDRAIVLGDDSACVMEAGSRLKGESIYYLESGYDGIRWCRFKMDVRTILRKLVCPNLRKTWERPFLVMAA